MGLFKHLQNYKMGLIISKRLTDDIYEKVDDASLFGHYYGQFSFKKAYPSVFRQDLNPSTGFYINQAGNIIYNDISTGEKLNIFAFVAKKYDLSYSEAVTRVACDFGIIPCDGVIPVSIEEINKGFNLANELKRETIIDIEYDQWNIGSLSYWKDYYITQAELEANDVYCIKRMRINGNYIPNIRSNLRFAYILIYKDKCYKKIYEPHAEKNYKWFNNIPLYLPFGYDSLPYDCDTLIITKAQKERILFRKYFTNVVAVQNESPASLRDVTLRALQKRFKNIYLFFDIDRAGLENAAYYEAKGITPIYLPLNLAEKGIKDSADFVKAFGLHRFEKFLNYNKVL